MTRDELREKIKAIIIEAREEDHHGNLLMYSDEATDSILSLLAPELERARLFILNKDYIDGFYSEAEKLRADAEKWRKVKEIAKTDDCYPICPFVDYCVNSDMPCCLAVVVDALEGEGEKG